jgi:hypothetical protein
MNLMCPPWYFELYQQKYARRIAAQQTQVQRGGGGSSASSNPSASIGFDHEEMGMTAERQRVIQASLFKMLGQADSAPSANTATAPTATATTTSESSTNGLSNPASGQDPAPSPSQPL